MNAATQGSASRKPSWFLDASRWAAALLVVASHVRHLLWIDYPKLQHAPGLAIKAIYFVTGLGHEAVVVFFVISGYLVGGVSLRRWRHDGIVGIREYATARIARIYTVFLPALLIAALFDFVGANWFDHAHLYSAPQTLNTVSLMGPIHDTFSAKVFFGNLAMLQTVLVPIFGTNGPMWSLAYEWWYYWIFFVGALFLLKKAAFTRAVCTAAVVAFIFLLPTNFWLMGILWIVGLALYFVAHRLRAVRISHPVLGFACFVGVLAWSRLSHNVDNLAHPESIFVSFRRDLLVAAGYSILAFSILTRESDGAFPRLHAALANFSYSSYLVHFPLLVLTAGVLEQTLHIDFLRQPSAAGVVYLIGMTLFLCVFAFAFSVVTERHTGTVREWLTAGSPGYKMAIRPDRP